MKYLAGGKNISFAQTQNDIVYLIESEFYVEDYMGCVLGNNGFNSINDASE